MPIFIHGAYLDSSILLKGIGSSTTNASALYVAPSNALTSSNIYFTYFEQPINSGIVSSSSTIYIAGPPTGGTITNPYSLNIASGNAILSGASSTLILANTTASTTSSTGALQVAGGAYLGANSLFAANLTLSGTSAVLSLTGTSSSLSISGTTSSTSSSTGTLQVYGGIGISKNIWLGSPFTGINASVLGSVLNIPSFIYTTSTTSPTNLNISSINQITLNGTGTATNSASLYIAGSPIAGTLAITNSYALQVAAGNSLFSGNLNIAGNLIRVPLIVTSTTSLTTSSPAYIVSKSSSALTITLPSIQTTATNGLMFIITNLGTGLVTLTVSNPGTESFDGSTTTSYIFNQYDRIHLLAITDLTGTAQYIWQTY